MVAVDDEMHAADAVHLDRRHRLTAALSGSESLPAFADARRRRPEEAIEIARAIDTADDGLDADDLQELRIILAGVEPLKKK